DHNKIERNNEDDVSYGYEAGGSKWDGDASETITNNTFSCNNGNGLWVDDGNRNSYIGVTAGGVAGGNISTHNLINGMPLEISHDDTVQNNTVTQNAQFNPCQCIAAHVPVLYNPGDTVAHDVCSGPGTQSSSLTSCNGSKNE